MAKTKEGKICVFYALAIIKIIPLKSSVIEVN